MFGLRQPVVGGGELAVQGFFTSTRTLSQLCHSKQASKFREFRHALLDYSVLLALVNRWYETKNDMNDNAVLSVSAQSELLAHREAALRSCGYEVFSTRSEIQARFEVEMGRCGVLLLCYTIHESIHIELAQLFGHSCLGGVIAFVMHPSRQKKSPHAHVCFLDSDFPRKLHLIEGARARDQKSA